MFTVKLYQGNTLSEGADLCLKARLYVPGWDLNPTLKRMRDYLTHSGMLAVGFENGQPVALCLFDGRMYMAFCRKDRRRLGYGSKCFQLIGRQPAGWAGEGVVGTLEFWKANGIYVLPRHRSRLKAA